MKKQFLIALIVILTSCYDMSKIRMEQYLNSKEHKQLIYDFLNDALNNKELSCEENSFIKDTATLIGISSPKFIIDFNDSLIHMSNMNYKGNWWIDVFSNSSLIKPLSEDDSIFIDLQMNKFKKFALNFDLIEKKFKMHNELKRKVGNQSPDEFNKNNYPLSIIGMPLFSFDKKKVFFVHFSILGLLGGEGYIYRFDFVNGKWSLTGRKMIHLS